MHADPKCAELARYFLPDADPETQEALAEEIQDTVERFDGEPIAEQWENENEYPF